MASSSDYYRWYKDEKKKVKDYDADLSDLWKIEGNMSNDLSDEISKINKEIDALQADLRKSVRHNEIFTKQIDQLEDEASVSLDANLQNADRELHEEITRVSGLKSTAISNRDYYYRMYEQKKAEESEARKEKLKNLLGLD